MNSIYFILKFYYNISSSHHTINHRNNFVVIDHTVGRAHGVVKFENEVDEIYDKLLELLSYGPCSRVPRFLNSPSKRHYVCLFFFPQFMYLELGIWKFLIC